jgi:hypothetical protein
MASLLKKVINNEPQETRLDWLTQEQIIGREIKKQKLKPPYFQVAIAEAEDERTLKFWLNKLKKRRVKRG